MAILLPRASLRTKLAFIRSNHQLLTSSYLGSSGDLTPTNLTTIDANAISLYPNPFTEVIHLEHNTVLSKFELTDMMGRTVKCGRLTTDGIIADLDHLPHGSYVLVLYNYYGQMYTLKILKK